MEENNTDLHQEEEPSQEVKTDPAQALGKIPVTIQGEREVNQILQENILRKKTFST